jgi:hypothetical protein
MVSVQFAGATDEVVSVGRASRLSVALAGLAQELASARREIRALKGENAALRAKLDGELAPMNGATRPERAVAQTLGFAQEAVDGPLPDEWERIRACWLFEETSADERGEPPTAAAEAAREREGSATL